MRRLCVFITVIIFVLVLAGCTSQTVSDSIINESAVSSTQTAPSPVASATTPEATPEGEDRPKIILDPPVEMQPTITPRPEPVYDETLTGKYVCLTFDDGPAGNNTPKILKALKQYGAMATFFVCGPESPQQRKLIRQINEGGHTIGIHCLSHDLKKLYESKLSFFADFDAIESIIVEETGIKPSFYRFPGGTNNSIIAKELSDDLILALKDRGYEYYDWNAVGNDEKRPPAEEIAATAISMCRRRSKATSPTILLLHDSYGRYTTGDAVPIILETLTKEGFQFIAISDKVKPHHLIKK